MRINIARIGTNGDIPGEIVTDPVLGTDLAAFKERGAAELGDGFGLKSVSEETIFIDPDIVKIGTLRQVHGEFDNFTGQVVSIEHRIGKTTKTSVTILKK